MSLLGALGAALAAGVLSFLLALTIRLTFGFIKEKIIERLKKSTSSIKMTEAAVIDVEWLLKNPDIPTYGLSSFGDEVQSGDKLLVGIKEDGSLEDEVNVLRAPEIDEQLQNVLQTNGAIKIDCRV